MGIEMDMELNTISMETKCSLVFSRWGFEITTL